MKKKMSELTASERVLRVFAITVYILAICKPALG